MSQVSAMSASGMEPSELAKVQADNVSISEDLPNSDENSQAGELA